MIVYWEKEDNPFVDGAEAIMPSLNEVANVTFVKALGIRTKLGSYFKMIV